MNAATFYWDTDTSTSGNSILDGTNLGGTGTWDTTTDNWWDGAGVSLVDWPNLNTDLAVFSGAYPANGIPVTNTVTLSTGLITNGLSFLRSGYVLTGGDLTLAGTNPGIRINLGESATITSPLSGTNGLTLSGGGSLRLTGNNSGLTGAVTIAGGSLIINSVNALPGTGTIRVTGGNDVPSNTSTIGFMGGSLVLDGSAGGLTLSRDLNLEGQGPIGGRGSALLSIGDNTLSGTVTSSVSTQTPATFRNTRITSVGTLNLSGTINAQGTTGTTVLTLGGVNAAGIGSYNLTGVLTGSGTVEKSGVGALFLNPSSTSGFGGTIRISTSATGQQSSVRVTQATVGGTSIFGANFGTGANAAIDLNGGVLEFRNDGNLDFGALSTGKNVYNRSAGIIFTGPAAGGAGINRTTTFGTLQHVISTTDSTATTTFNSRNGFGVTFSTMAMDASTSSSALTNTLTNNMGGVLTFTGNLTLGEGNTASRPRELLVGGTGNTVFQGSVIAGTDPGKTLTKSGAGSLTIQGVGTTVAGAISITAGAIIATDFRSLNNNTAAISLGNATTTGGNLIIGGTGTAPTVAGLTTGKTITLNTTSGSNSIYANQTGINPVILNGAITKIAAATTGNLILGGTNTADNIVNVVIPVEPTASTGGLIKLGAGTWVLNNANTYLGATTIQNGTLKLRATGGASDVIGSAASNTIVFSGDGTSGSAAGTLEFRGILNTATTETLGALTPTAGAATIVLLGNGTGAANLTFTSLGATAAASSVNFDTGSANGGVITLTGQAATTATTLPGTANFRGHLYINGADFAAINGSAQVVAPTYAGSGDFQNTAGALVSTVHNNLMSSFTNGAVTVSSLRTNSQTLTLSGNLTVSLGAILQSGGTATIQSNSGTARTIVGSAAAVNIAIRVNGVNDVLNLGTNAAPVNISSTTTGGLTKNGAGTLVVSGTNAQTGTTNINEGTVRLSGSLGRLSATSASAVIRQGAVLELDGAPDTNYVVNALDGAGTITNVNATAATFTVGSGTGSGTWNGIFADGAGVLHVTKGGTTGAPIWSNLNTYTGLTTIAGTTGSVTVDYLANGGQASGIGASSNAAANLVFAGTTGGLIYRGSIINGSLTLGSRSATTDRLFTLAGTAVGSGASISSTVTNNNAIVWSNTGAIAFGPGAVAQTLILTGTSTGDNTFNPQLTDNGANVTSLTKTAAGQWNLGNSNNTYTGLTTIAEGTLGLNDNGALPANSPLVLGSTTTSGILQMSGAFARNLAATATAGSGTITWGGTTGGGGFAAHATSLTVTLNAGAGLTWGSGGFVGTGGTQALIFGSASALADVTFTNAIDLGAAVRTVTVNENGNTGAEFAVLSGALSGTGGGLLKNGSGVLTVSDNNTYTGITEVQAGTLIVTSLGHSSDPLNTATSVGLSGVTMDNSNAVVLGNATTTGGLLQYVGGGEVSDRKIRLRGTTASNQIHADGSGPLVLTNVAHDTTETGNKTLFLRGTNTAGNMIASQLSDNGVGVLSVTVDGGASWILTNSANNYTGTTSANAGALGIGHNTAIGTGTLSISNGNVFAYGGDRTIANALSLATNAVNGWLGDYSLTFNGTNSMTGTTSSLTLTTNNSIAAGKSLTINGMTSAATSNRNWNFDGPGETVLNGIFDAAAGVNLIKTGDGTLVLGTNGGASDWNQSATNVDIDRGTLRFTANEAIPSVAGAGGLIVSPEVATADTAIVDLNGTTQTINALTAATDGVVVLNNTAATPATFRFGANDSAVSFGAGTGTFTITDTGAGALSIVKLGTQTGTIAAGVTLTYQGATRVEGGTLTVASPLNGTTSLQVVNSGSTLNLSGGLSAANLITSVTVENGGILSLLDGAGNKLSGLTGLQLGSTSGTMTTLNLNVGDGPTAGDELNTDLLTLLTGGTLSLFAGNQVTLNLTDIGLNPNQTYDLISVVDGGLTTGVLGVSDWILGAAPGGFATITLNRTDTLIQLQTGNLITGSSWWNAGGTLDNWNDVANWSVDLTPPTPSGGKAGTNPAVSTPGQGTDVIFIADNITGGAAITTTLEQNFKINSLTFEASTNPADTPISVTMAPGAVSTNRLEVAPQSASVGVAVTAGGPPSVTISAPFKIGTNQTWTVADAASVLTLSGGLQGEADVAKSGAGKVILAAAADPTFNSGLTSDFTVNAGNLEFTNIGALGTAANNNLVNMILNGGGFYYNNGTGGTVPLPLTLSGGTLSGGGGNHTYSGNVNITAGSFINLRDSNSATLTTTQRDITLSGVLSGSGDLTVDSINTVSTGNQLTGNLIVSGANGGWSGTLNILRGTVIARNIASALGTGDITASLGKIEWEGAGGATYTLNRDVTVADAAANAVLEWNIDRTSGTDPFTVTLTGTTTLGGAGGTGELRILLADGLSSAANFNGPVVLANNAAIHVRDAATSFATINGVISEVGGARSLIVNGPAGGGTAWGGTAGILQLLAANAFTGDVTIVAGTLEFNTVTNAGGAASSLGQGNAIAMSGGTLRFVGSSPQATNRPITTATGAVTLSANGATAADTITLNGLITIGPTADGTQVTLAGAAGRVGVIAGGLTQTGDTADAVVNGGTWTHQTGTSRIGDVLTVTGNGTILNLNSGLFQVRNDFVVTADAVLNLGGTGALSFSTTTLSADASLRAQTGGVINWLATNGVVVTDFDGLRIGTDGVGVGTANLSTFDQSVTDFILGNRNLDRSGLVNGTGTLTTTGNIDLYGGSVNADMASTGTVSLDKFSMNTVTLAGDNSGLAGTGITLVEAGTLILNYASSTATKVRAASQLDMRGSNLTLQGNASSAVVQGVGSMTLGSGGGSRINMTSAGQDIVLNLNAFTRAVNAQDGTLHIVLPTGTQSATNGATTDTLNTIGTGTAAILGGWLTVNDGSGVFFARNATGAADGNIVAATTTLQDTVASWVAGDNISDSSGFTGTVTGIAINSLRFNAAAGSDLGLGASGVLGINSGGILVTSSVGGTPSIVGGTIFSGAQASNVPELIVIQDSSATFEIGADLRTNSAFTKSGAETVFLSGNNVYTGNTEIQEGTLQVGGTGIGDTSLVTLAANRNTVLELLADETIGRLQGGSRQTDQDFGTVAVGSNTLTINESASTTYAGFFTGNGTLVMNTGNTGNLNLTNVSAGFTGSVVISGGLFQLSGIGQVNASSFTINKGGNLLIDNNGTTRSGTRIVDNAAITLNSADGAFSGQTRPRGLALRTDQDATLDETVGVVTVASGANYSSLDATSSNDDSDIIAFNIVRASSATFNVRGTNLGGTSAQRNEFRIGDATNQTNFIATLVGGGGAAASQNISIVPWAIGETLSGALGDANMGNTLLTYVSGSGFRPLAFATEYDTIAAAAATDNARESLAADLTALAGTTVNSLVIDNIAFAGLDVTGSGVGQTLAVTSGALLFTVSSGVASAAYDTTLGGFDSGITVGGTNEYVVFVVNPSSATTTSLLTARIASPLTSTADITKSGRGTLILSATNTAGGGTRKTTLNEGVLEIADLDNIGGNTGALVFAGGTLRLSNAPSPVYSGDDLSARTISFLLGGGTLDTNGLDIALANSLGSGVGGFTKAGAGNLTLNATASYTGSTRVTVGTVTVGANNALGVGGDLSLAGGATLALGTNGITHALVTTSGASPAITGAGTITASTGFYFNHIGDTVIDALLAGAGGLLKAQANLVTLTGLSTYAGTTEIQAGTLSINSLTNVGGGASSLGAPTTAENGIIRMGLTTVAATLTYTGTGHTSNRIIGMQGTTGGATIDADGTGALVLGSGARFENAGNKTLVLRGSAVNTLDNSIGEIREIGGVLTLNKSDANTWLLTAVNSYTGATQVDEGTLKIGLDNALPLTTAVRIGTGATAGTLDLNGFNQTIGSLVVQSTSDLVTNNIIVDSTKTLTINGAVTLGIDANAADTNVIASGGGAIIVNSGGANFIVGAATGATNDSRVDADFSGLTNFTANLGVGTFRLGDVNTGTENNPSNFKLAVNNTINAALVRIGDGAGGGVPTTHTLTLGSGTNALNADTINIGSAGATTRSGGAVVFDAGDTTGSVTLRASNGTDRTILNMINTTGNTSGSMESTLALVGHTADIFVSTMTMATRSANTGAATATLSFDQGILDITTLTMASRTSTGTGNATATVNLGDSAALGVPTTTIGALAMAVNTSAGGSVTADFNVTGGNVTIGTGSGTAINMANAGTGRTVTSNMTLTGGTTSVTGNIVRTGGAGTENAVITLNGGALNMNAKTIGAAGAGLITFNAQAGTLSNLAELNGGAGLTKTGGGTLVMEGTNTYTGGTFLDAGILQVNSLGAVGTTGDLDFGGGTLQYSVNNTTDYAARIVNSTAAIKIDTNGQEVTFATGLANTNTGGLTKEGSGILTLNGANAYTGATSVNAGTLTVGGSLGAGTVTVGSGSAAVLNGAGTIGGALTVTSTGTFSPGADDDGLNNNGVGVMNVASADWQTNSTIVFDFALTDDGSFLGTPTDWDYVNITGSGLTLGTNITLSIRSWTAASGIYGANNFNENSTQVVTPPPGEGLPAGSDPAAYRWLWVDNAGLANDDELTQFTIDTSNFFHTGTPTATNPYAQPLTGGHFWVSSFNNDLYINYSAVPEPGSLLLVGLASLGFAGYRRRKRRQDFVDEGRAEKTSASDESQAAE